MTLDTFKLIHSELIKQVQLIENDLRLIYAAMKPGDFDDNFDTLERANLGRISMELKQLDYSDGYPDLAPEDYETIDSIRLIRNYWCHQCYLDFVYLSDEGIREEKFGEISERLVADEKRVWSLHKKLEKIRNIKLVEYRA